MVMWSLNNSFIWISYFHCSLSLKQQLHRLENHIAQLKVHIISTKLHSMMQYSCILDFKTTYSVILCHNMFSCFLIIYLRWKAWKQKLMVKSYTKKIVCELKYLKGKNQMFSPHHRGKISHYLYWWWPCVKIVWFSF